MFLCFDDYAGQARELAEALAMPCTWSTGTGFRMARLN